MSNNKPSVAVRSKVSLNYLRQLAKGEKTDSRIEVGSPFFIEQAKRHLKNIDQNSVTWTNGQIVHFLKTGDRPQAIEPVTKEQIGLRPETYTEGLCLQWLAKVEPAMYDDTQEMEAAILVRVHELFELESGVTREDAANLLLHKTPIPRAANGVLINDLVRDSRSAEDWSDEDLRAYLSGEVKASARASDDDLRAEVMMRFDDEVEEETPAIVEPVPTPVPEVEEPASPAEPDPQENEEPTAEEALQVLDHPSIPTQHVPVFDAAREFKPARDWSQAELVALCKGEIQIGNGCTPQTVIRALRKWYELPEAWSYESVKLYVATGKTPAKTSAGLWVEDLQRSIRNVHDWSKDELKAYLAGEIAAPVKETPAGMLLAIRIAFGASDKWNDRQVTDFVLHGQSPETVEGGVMVDDPARLSKPAKQWTVYEVKAFLQGQIGATTAAPEADLFEVARIHFKAASEWTDANVRDYVTKGVYPAKTSNGLWVEDRLRVKKELSEYSVHELWAHHKNEITLKAKGSKQEYLNRLRQLLIVTRFPEIAEWSDKELVEYIATETKPKLTKSGFYQDSPVRAAKGSLEWTKPELVAFLKGELPASKNAVDSQLIEAIYRKWLIPFAWSEQQARDYVLRNITPKQTSDGVWIQDQTREYRRAFEWTFLELRAWARGLITPGRFATEEDLVSELRIRLNMTAPLSGQMLKQLLSNLPEEPVKMSLQYIEEALKEYEAGMALGKPLTEKDAAAFQAKFYRTLNRVLNEKGRDFTEGWGRILNFVNTHSNSLFSLTAAYRGFGQLNLSDRDRKNFEQLLTLIMRTSNAATRREQVKGINFNYVLRGILNEDVRHQIQAFYNLG